MGKEIITDCWAAYLFQRYKSITRRRLVGNSLDRSLLAQWNGGHVRGAVGAEGQLDWLYLTWLERRLDWLYLPSILIELTFLKRQLDWLGLIWKVNLIDICRQISLPAPVLPLTSVDKNMKIPPGRRLSQRKLSAWLTWTNGPWDPSLPCWSCHMCLRTHCP